MLALNTAIWRIVFTALLLILWSLSTNVDAKGPIGTWKIAVLMVDFPDAPGTTDPQHYRDLLFGDQPPNVPHGSFKDYFKEVSYNQLIATGQVNNEAVKWYRLPHDSSYYGNINMTEGNLANLLPDAVAAARDGGFDFGPFDTDNDGFVDAIFIIRTKGAGSFAHPDPVFRVDTGATNAKGEAVSSGPYIVISEEINTRAGVFAHEFGHVLGLPDLYDLDGSSRGLGSWSRMGSTDNAHLDAWSKVKLGWVEPIVLTSPMELIIPPVEANKAIYKIPITEKEYFLLENRQNIGFDAELPGSGLLIYHVDEAVNETFQMNNMEEWYPGCTGCTSHYLVALEQADGRWDLEKKVNGGDPGDPFPGSTGNTAFTDTTTPNSRSYSGASTAVSISNIRQEGQNILLTFGNPPSDPPPSADLAVTQTDSPDPVIVWEHLIYMIAVTNQGPSDATGVMLSENLPGSVTWISSSSSQGSCSGTATITCTLGAIRVNTTATVLITVRPDAEGEIVNTASVAADENDANPSNNTAKATTSVRPQPVIPTADLSISQTDTPDPVVVGNPLIYTITVKNNGPSEATGVTFTDTLPSGVSLKSATSSQGNCSPSGQIITCALGDLSAGTTTTVTLTVTPSSRGTSTNAAEVSGNETDPDNANNRSQIQTTVTAPTSQRADLAASLTATSETVMVSQHLTATLTITNHGPDAAADVAVTGTLPERVTFISINPSQGTCAGESAISCNIGRIDSQESVTVEMVISPNEPGSLMLSASVVSGTSDPNDANNSGTMTVNALPSDEAPDGDGGGAPPVGDDGPPAAGDQVSGGGSSGGGCAMSPNGAPDFGLVVLLGGILLCLIARKRWM